MALTQRDRKGVKPPKPIQTETQQISLWKKSPGCMAALCILAALCGIVLFVLIFVVRTWGELN